MLPVLQRYYSKKPAHGSVLMYLVVNKQNGKLYVGQTLQSAKKRFSQHAVDRKSILGRAIRKYGKKAFNVIILDLVSRKEAADTERAWISKAQSVRPQGCNISPGGENGPIHSDSSKKLMRKRAKERLTPDEIERRRERGRIQAETESAADYATRIEKHKATKSTIEWKANASRVQKAARQRDTQSAEWNARFDTQIKTAADQRLESWRKDAIALPVPPKDRVANCHYIDQTGQLYVARADGNVNPSLRKVTIESILKDRKRTKKSKPSTEHMDT